MGRFQLKYILQDSLHGTFEYTVYDSLENRIIAVDPTKLIKSGAYIQLDNAKFVNGELNVTGAKILNCGVDYTKYSGRLLVGFNDFETYCLRHKLQRLIEEYDCNKNTKPIDGIAAKAIDRVWWKCKICGYEWQAIIKNRTSGYMAGCPMCSFKGGKYQTLVPGVNDLETWCKANNRLDIIEEYALDNKFTPDKISHANNTQKIKFTCRICGQSYEALLANRIKSRGCPSCNLSGTSFPEVAIYNALSSLFDPIYHRVRGFEPTNKMELDIYIKELNLGIEYDGALWHSDDEAIIRESNKDAACRNAGIRLLRVKEIPNFNKKAEISGDYIYCRHGGRDTDYIIKVVICWLNSNYNLGLSISDSGINNAIASAKAQLNNREVPNSLAVAHPEVAARWDYSKNGNFKPTMVTSGCKYKAWFICPVCHNSYYSYIRKQVEGHRCPICAGQQVVTGYNDLATVFPYVLPFWDYTKNDAIGIKPNRIASKSGKSAYWKCPTCGLETYYPISAFTNKFRCMKCRHIIKPRYGGGEA